MQENLKIINIAELTRRMGKSRQWFYQRLNGNIVNGKPAQFTQDEKNQIGQILREVKKEIGDIEKTFTRKGSIKNIKR